MTDRPSWDDWALGIAHAVAARADCTRRKIGAVILDSEHRIVSTGYNGSPPGGPSCRGQSELETRNLRLWHMVAVS
jgi:deoxycytidylate deaminase